MIWFRLVDTVVSTSQLLALLSPITDVRDYVNYDNQEKEETQGPSNSYRDYLVIQINSASFRGRIEFGVIRGVNFYLELTPSDRNTRLVNTIGIVESALTSIRLLIGYFCNFSVVISIHCCCVCFVCTFWYEKEVGS